MRLIVAIAAVALFACAIHHPVADVPAAYRIVVCAGDDAVDGKVLQWVAKRACWRLIPGRALRSVDPHPMMARASSEATW
jgi:trehalose-6-phosphatase